MGIVATREGQWAAGEAGLRAVGHDLIAIEPA